ncbi:MAG: hypothetical protein AAFR21_10690 [Pseudomonadota bacterium]
MATLQETRLRAAETIRTGWLAYLGLYGTAFDRAKPRFEELSVRAREFFGELVEKGEEVENVAQETIGDVRERTHSIYSAGLTRAKDVMPSGVAANDRVAELEAEVEALTKQVAGLKKKPAARKTTKAKAKAA